MTIKEVEARSGIGRANIRYYEQAGLLQPQRRENGYRDYSEEDVRTLMRVLLLRRLGVSIEEIRAIQQGEKPLGEAMQERAAALEALQREAAEACHICRAIRAEGSSYATLEPEKYLTKAPPAPALEQEDALPPLCHPWRRFFAQNLDFSLYYLLWSMVLCWGFGVNMLQRGTFLSYLDQFLCFILMLFTEPLLLHWLGTTPGKWIFGLHMENEDGSRLTYGEGLERTWYRFGKGEGYGIPVLIWVRQYQSYKRGRAGEAQPWDAGLRYTIRDTKWYRGLAFLAATGAIVGLHILVFLVGRVPSNRTPLTITAFAQNYNQLVHYYQIEGARLLNSQGEWETPDGVVIVDFFGQTPAFQYTLSPAGEITALSFRVEAGGEDWVRNYGLEMTLSALAFAGAQPSLSALDGVRDQIVETIEGAPFASFQLPVGDMEIRCQVEREGYLDGGSFIVPQEDMAETARFVLEYTIE